MSIIPERRFIDTPGFALASMMMQPLPTPVSTASLDVSGTGVEDTNSDTGGASDVGHIGGVGTLAGDYFPGGMDTEEHEDMDCDDNGPGVELVERHDMEAEDIDCNNMHDDPPPPGSALAAVAAALEADDNLSRTPTMNSAPE